MRAVDIIDAGPQFPELVEAAVAGEEVVITRRGKPLVRLLPLAQQVPMRRLGTLAGKIRIADDFDLPLQGFYSP
ncbi:type II toxin-antitoxin system [compost metagenome]